MLEKVSCIAEVPNGKVIDKESEDEGHDKIASQLFLYWSKFYFGGQPKRYNSSLYTMNTSLI